MSNYRKGQADLFQFLTEKPLAGSKWWVEYCKQSLACEPSNLKK